MKYLKQIPSGWNEVKVSTYLEVINQLPAEQPEDYTDEEYYSEILEVWFHALTGEDLSLVNIKADEIQAIVMRLKFLNELPNQKTTKIKVKYAKDLSYQEFINYQQYSKDAINNMGAIVKLFSVDELKEDEINVADAFSCFFLLQKNASKSLRGSLISLSLVVIKQSLKALWKKATRWFKTSSI